MAFKVGDTVRLTGTDWDGLDPKGTPKGSEHEIVAVKDGIARIAAGGAIGETGYMVFDPADAPHWSYGKDFVRYYAAELVTPEPERRAPKVGDKVRLVGAAWTKNSGYPNEGTIVTVTEATEGGSASAGNAGLILNGNGEPYVGFGFEFVEDAPTPKVGDKVRLTGRKWDGQGFVPAKGEYEIAKADRGGKIVTIKDGWSVCLDPEVSNGWEGVLVTAAEAPKPEPLADWERELLEGPAQDATGYPVGTPRSAKDIPSTQQIKGTYQESAETDNTAERSALLAEFNRWYEAEIAEVREEAWQAGYSSGFAEGQDQVWHTVPKDAYAVFVGPFEVFTTSQAAEDRLNELLADDKYATVLQTLLHPSGDVSGFTVQAPTIDQAQPGRIS